MKNLFALSSLAAFTVAVNLKHFDAEVPVHVHDDTSFPDDGFHAFQQSVDIPEHLTDISDWIDQLIQSIEENSTPTEPAEDSDSGP